jgi:nucleotide-binding universal stress UspA family protein
MERLAASLRSDGHDVTVISQTGDVAGQIISTGMDADLVIMTTHGRGAAGRLIFGSVADRVVRQGMTPTLLLRRGAHTKTPQPPKRVLVTLDGSEEAELSLPAGRKLARVLSVPIILLRAVGFDEIRATLRDQREAGGPSTIDSADRYEQARLATVEEAKRYLAVEADQLRAEGLDAESQVVEGTPAFSLMWAMTPEDVVVTTTHGTGGYKRWQIGSVAEKLVRQSPCPVLLQRVPSEKEKEKAS